MSEETGSHRDGQAPVTSLPFQALTLEEQVNRLSTRVLLLRTALLEIRDFQPNNLSAIDPKTQIAYFARSRAEIALSMTQGEP